MVSLAIIIVAVAGGLIAFQTGEHAEETAENISGVTEETIEEHEESAELTNLFVIGLGVLVITTIFAEVKRKRFAKGLLVAVLVLSVVTFYFVAVTASLGGKIRHTEIQSRL